jgi:hypothetical protein
VDLSGLVDALRQVGPRPACSDGERRAAKVLTRELKALGRRPRTETLWVRPQWPAVWLVLALAGVAGSVVSAGTAPVGLGICAAAALVAVLELGGRVPALSLLWPRRATQNVVSRGPGEARVRLLVTAAYDAPRAPSGLGAPLGRLDRGLRRATRGVWPSPLGLLTLALIALAGCAGARLGGIEDTWLGALQLVPTVVCIVAVALLAELALSPAAEADNLTASAPAAALAVTAALDRRPPRRLEVDLVLAGAGDAQALGMRRHVRGHRGQIRAEEIAVLHLEPCGAGDPRAWRRDGPLLTLRLHPDLVAAAEEAGFAPFDGRGTTGALAARRARWPAVAVGRLQAGRAADAGVDEGALEDTVERCVALVRRLDARLAGRSS